MNTTYVTSDSEEQANLNSTTHDQSITSTPPEAIAADTTCISAMPCLFETNSVPGVSVPVQVADACLTDTGAPIDRSPLITSPESAIESSATDPVESASVIGTEIVENEVVPLLPMLSPSCLFTNKQNELLIVLMKLRLNLMIEDLARHFGIGMGSVSCVVQRGLM